MWPRAAFLEQDSQANAATFAVLSRDLISYSFFGREGKGGMGKMPENQLNCISSDICSFFILTIQETAAAAALFVRRTSYLFEVRS